MTEDDLSPAQEAELDAMFEDAAADHLDARLLAAGRRRQHAPKPALRPGLRPLRLPALWSGLAAALLLLALLPTLFPGAAPSTTAYAMSDPFGDAALTDLQVRVDRLRQLDRASSPRLGSTTLFHRKNEEHRIRFDLQPLTF